MKKIIIALVCLLIVISAAGGYFYMKKPGTSNTEVIKSEPVEEDYSAYTNIVDIYYSSNNGKRTRLVVMDLAVEAKNESAKIKLNANVPKIKAGVLKILALEKYKSSPDHLLLNYINDNIKNDLKPLLIEISEHAVDSNVHVTRLIIQ